MLISSIRSGISQPPSTGTSVPTVTSVFAVNGFNFGGRGQIALELQVEGKLVAAVGDQVAGGEEEAVGHWGTTESSWPGLPARRSFSEGGTRPSIIERVIPKDGCAGQARALRVER